MDRKSTHGYFFNPELGLADAEVPPSELYIGNDVWLGHGSILTTGVHSVGDGAVVGAGAVVFRDVPPYAVVVGNPARVVRYRFGADRIAQLLEERWWERDIQDLDQEIVYFTRPLGDSEDEPRRTRQ